MSPYTRNQMQWARWDPSIAGVERAIIRIAVYFVFFGSYNAHVGFEGTFVILNIDGSGSAAHGTSGLVKSC